MARFAQPEDIDLAQLPEASPREQVLADLALDGADVADIGAGAGTHARLMATHGARVLAVEPNAAVLALLDTDGLAITPVHGGAETARLAPASLDIVTFFYSLHHIPEDVCAAGLDNAARALKPGGVLYIVEPVALGPAFLVSRPIDDETLVRRRALEILDQWLASSQFSSAHETLLRYQQIYTDYAAFKAHMLQVDGRRAQAFETNGGACRALFEKHGTPTPKGFAFDAALRTIVIR